jgi:hypothetical protein
MNDEKYPPDETATSRSPLRFDVGGKFCPAIIIAI